MSQGARNQTRKMGNSDERTVPANYAGTLNLPLNAEEEHDQVDHKKQDDGAFQQEHPAIVLIVFKELIQVVQRFELLIDGAMPVGQMEPGGDVLVNARQMPVSEEFRDVREFIIKPRQIDANFLQLVQNKGAAPPGGDGEVAIRALQSLVQEPVVGFQFRQLQIGQLHDVERVLKIIRLIDQQRRVPIDDCQIVLIIT